MQKRNAPHHPFRVTLTLTLLILVGALLAILPSVAARDYQAEIDQKQTELDSYRAQAESAAAQAATLQEAVNDLVAQKNQIQAQIDLNNIKVDQTKQQIKDAEVKLAKLKDILAKSIVNNYLNDQITPIEILASSTTIAEYTTKQAQQDNIKRQSKSVADSVKQTKEDLEAQKKELEHILADQQSKRSELAGKEAEQASLLTFTKGQEAEYQRLVTERQAEINYLREQQSIINNRYGNISIVDTIAGDYPWNESNCPMWGMLSTGGANGSGGDGHGYGCRQCASYAAWRAAKETGIYPSWGNANQFDDHAAAAGFTVSAVPRDRSIGVMEAGYYGHVVWVEAVNGDGTIRVAQYNYNYGTGWGMFSRMNLPISAFDKFIYF
jgi:surface antigen/uncharacterized membrane-anchored protein YhcB (DUF1043 family)